MTRIQETIQLHKAQYDFCHSDAVYRGFVGGRGAGKTMVGAYDLLRRAKPGRLYGAYAPTYPMIRDATWRSFLQIGKRLRFVKDVLRADMRVVLGNGAEVLFRSLDDPERARGPNLSGAWIDEASLVKQDAFDIVIAALREGGEQGWLSATFTPKGKDHWTYQVFGQGRSGAKLFHARTNDNPFLPPVFTEALRAQYTAQFAAQEIGGEFVDIEGTLAKREWFEIVSVAPSQAKRVRFWDFAATAKQTADYTVGLRLALANGVYYVENVTRGHWGPGQVEAVIRQTAESDGRAVSITMEQEPGSGGKLFTGAMIKALAGWTVRALPASGDKVTRAMPWLAQAEAGNVKLVRGEWVSAWLDEIAAFPEGGHDDQVDAMSGAFGQLTHTGWARGIGG